MNVNDLEWKNWTKRAAALNLIVTGIRIVIFFAALAASYFATDVYLHDDVVDSSIKWMLRIPEEQTYETHVYFIMLWVAVVVLGYSCIAHGLSSFRLLEAVEMGRKADDAKKICESWRKNTLILLVIEGITYSIAKWGYILFIECSVVFTLIFLVTLYKNEMGRKLKDKV